MINLPPVVFFDFDFVKGGQARVEPLRLIRFIWWSPQSTSPRCHKIAKVFIVANVMFQFEPMGGPVS